MIFVDGVNDNDDPAVVEGSLLFDDKFLTLHKLLLLLLLLSLLMPAFKFIRLSFCTFFLTT